MVKGRGVIVARSWEEVEDILIGRECEGREVLCCVGCCCCC